MSFNSQIPRRQTYKPPRPYCNRHCHRSSTQSSLPPIPQAPTPNPSLLSSHLNKPIAIPATDAKTRIPLPSSLCSNPRPLRPPSGGLLTICRRPEQGSRQKSTLTSPRPGRLSHQHGSPSDCPNSRHRHRPRCQHRHQSRQQRPHRNLHATSKQEYLLTTRAED